MDTKAMILNKKLIAIIRNIDPEYVLEVCRALHKGGIQVMEITMNSPKALPSIEKVTNELGDEVIVGAGTVLDPETARAAILAGAQFIISPTVHLETIKMTKRYGIVSIPGAFTPTEILTAYEHGADMVKVFPASLGPGYIKDILGPLSQIPLLATGGVSLENIKAYLAAGAIGCGIGSSLVNSKESITSSYFAQLTEKAKQFSLAVQEFRNNA
ncbi:bifunctional 4-hydroxy-2-oxoglutarate aldolase/2-dehydro-3-deoxy-phosphogluconate aldolase [Lederbergia sp. NSJ-179]|uniref:bifunctional 4-hydroxy-2-oxoglutarate aldolase/2-dehydro-3-deoxy-phosphogluconate aldolase n=1 Tax=Lederbergia sp. NSJ-179 TaxID=2931402 RepID=UPI001FD19CD9|nr:bifunctional 4-hydroxy-2-oxoglutarate aldolase/2-dehydro-3-deoxy-phosphogluconate aldolase [Lederbergia sp. NSJ-179]MCJ7841331.1 bifunctional 4-hydroxy-2-oxoglutarate aldolase/2-dehydro-3-deoxy-phosphogluconate aldolase [Lederbergia sp. NSJ-179]